MHFLLFTSLLLVAPPAEDHVVRRLDVYTVESQTKPAASNAVGERVVFPEVAGRRATHRAKSRAGTASTAAYSRRASTAARVQYVTGSFGTAKLSDDLMRTTPSPSLPDTISVVPGGIEPIPAPPTE